VSARPMSVYVDKMWVRQEGRYWIAKAIVFSENDNDVTISACPCAPQLSEARA